MAQFAHILRQPTADSGDCTQINLRAFKAGSRAEELQNAGSMGGMTKNVSTLVLAIYSMSVRQALNGTYSFAALSCDISMGASGAL